MRYLVPMSCVYCINYSSPKEAAIIHLTFTNELTHAKWKWTSERQQTAFSSRPFRRSEDWTLFWGYSQHVHCDRFTSRYYVREMRIQVNFRRCKNDCWSLSACMVNHQPFAAPSQTLTTRNENGEHSQCIIPCLHASRTRCTNLYSQHED